MSNKFPSDPNDDQMPARKSSQQLLLLLLLLLVALFAYLYFFTGLIKARDSEPKSEPASQAAVKTPLPPRPDLSAQPATQAAKAGEPAVSGSAPAATPAGPEPAPQPKGPPPAPRPKPVRSAATVAPVPPSPARTAAPAREAKPVAAAESKPAVTAAVPAREARPAAAVKVNPAAKPATQAGAAARPPGAKKTVVTAAEKPQPAAKPSAVYRLEVKGEFAESELGAVTAKLKKAGIGQLVKTRAHKSEPMHRLFMADFANRGEALEDLQRLKQAAPSAFILNEKGRYTVYAGSFLRQEKAAAEQGRLLAKGVKVLVRDATASVPVTRVRAGSFADRASADRALKALQKAGLAAKVVKIGK